MTLAYVLFCFPISYEENSVANSIWCGVPLPKEYDELSRK